MRLSSLLLASFLVVAAVPAFGDDMYPPPWRGEEGTTLTIWEFGTDDPEPLPDFEFNPYGQASAAMYPGVGQEWWDLWGGRQGVWPLSGTSEFTIPNRPEPLPYKDIWVQITWAPQAPDTYPLVSEKDSATPGTVINELQLEATLEDPPADDFWYHTTFLIHLEPNPDFEIVKIIDEKYNLPCSPFICDRIYNILQLSAQFLHCTAGLSPLSEERLRKFFYVINLYCIRRQSLEQKRGSHTT